MNIDCAFYIGSTHEVCQDYAITGKNSVTISDGCSGSILSDIGSRVLSVTAMNKIAEIDSLYNFDEKECILLARPSIKMLNIPDECLDATLLSAVAYEEDDYSQAMCYGDGVIVIRTKEEETIIINCEYTDNYPFYINYIYDKTGRYKNWKENHNNRKITQTVIGANGDIIFAKTITDSTRLFGNLGIIKISDNNVIIEMSETKQLTKFIAVMSDGIHSFYETIMTETSKCNRSISYIEVLKDLLNFKNYNKLFIQRRVNKFRKKYIKENKANYDDLSIGAIYFD